MKHFSLHRKFSAISAIACVLVATFIPAAGQVRVKRGIAAPQQIAATPSAPNAAFTAGDLVIYRVGTGAAALTSAATAGFLDEYSTAGALVQSIALATADSGINQTCTNSGSATSEGLITRSTNGVYLVFGCYDAAVGTAAVAGTSTGTVLRVVGRADSAGNVDTSTTTTSFSGGNIRGVASTDGTNLWMSGSNTGVVYNTFGGSGPGTLVSISTTNLRSIEIFNNQLYATSGSGGSVGINSIGTGLPTTAASSTLSGNVTAASSTTPIVITTADTTGLSNGQVVTVGGISGAGTNGNANGTYYIKVTSSTTFEEYFDKNLTIGRASSGAGIGAGSPTWNVFTNPPSNQVVANNGTGSPYQFFFADLDAGTPGLDTAYYADDGASGGIFKYSLVGGTWVSNGSVTLAGTRGMTGKVSGGLVTLYVTTGTTLQTFSDTNGYNALPNGTLTLLATAATNTAFRGVALAPTAVTAAGVNVSGHVLGNNGLGVRNARVTITDQHGVTRTATTNAFGYYSFDNVMVGEAYIVSAGARGYTFPQRLVQVFNSMSTVDITPNR